MTATRILVIGATGLIGRPVTQQLCAAGFDVRAMVRDAPRAAASLGNICEFMTGDLRDPDSIERALDGMDAVYLSLSQPMTAGRPDWDPDVDGTRAVAEAMQRTGVRRLVRLSAMGVERDDDWWVARAKRDFEIELLDRELDVTVFRPTWFMESIPLSSIGPLLIQPTMRREPLFWLAAEDFGRQVCAALRDDSTIGQIIESQGPEPVSMRDACRRFARVWRASFIVVPAPRVLLKLAAPLLGPAAYLDALLDMTYDYVVTKPAETNGHALYRPTVTIEQFAASLLATNDWPRKKL